MKKATKLGLGLLTVGLVIGLSACGDDKKDTTTTGDETKTEQRAGEEIGATSVALITDVGGVDDKSFNQSAWEGMQEFGEMNGLSQGKDGYTYFQSNSESDYNPNINQAVQQGFKTIFGIGYKLKPAIEENAGKHADTNFVIVDDVIEGKDNVASATFKDQEAAYLAGIAAAMTTETKKVGFVGGAESEVIDRFQAGFEAGVHSVDPDIKVDVKYAGDFGAPDKGKTIAASMYSSGVDIIYHAAGGTGNGVFSEAKAINEKGDKKVWVIGVDRDQTQEGEYTTKDGKKDNFTLTSTTKGVSATVIDLSTKAMNGEFPGGEHLVYGLKEDAVGLTEGQLKDDVIGAVKEAREKIIAGEIEVPEKPE